MDIKSFTIDIPEAALDDLHRALARTRWPDDVEDAGWDLGANLGAMKELADYWQNHYDWHARRSVAEPIPPIQG